MEGEAVKAILSIDQGTTNTKTIPASALLP
jgi:glycerol kinase